MWEQENKKTRKLAVVVNKKNINFYLAFYLFFTEVFGHFLFLPLRQLRQGVVHASYVEACDAFLDSMETAPLPCCELRPVGFAYLPFFLLRG